MGALLLLTLLLGAQQDETREYAIQRVSKDAYLNALRELDRAQELIDSGDPRGAIEKITSVLGNSRIKYFECRLRIEVQPSIYEKYTFFPYQLRAKARLAAVKKLDAPAAKEPILREAIEDLKISVEKKVGGSADLLKDAEAQLKAVQAKIAEGDIKDPVTEIRPRFSPLVSTYKFRSAVNLVNGPDGQKLSAEDKKTLLQEVEDACRAYLDGKISNFRSNLAVSLSNIAGMKEGEFRSAFSMPAPDEITIKEPAFDWCRKHYNTLKTLQLGKAKPEEILAAAQEALALDASGDASAENPYFKSMAGFGFELCDNVIRARIEKAAKQRKDDRLQSEADAAKFQTIWKDFIAKLDKKIIERHQDLDTWTRDLESKVSDFPKELPGLASISIDDCFKEDPVPALDKVEGALRNLDHEVQTKGRCAIESKQALYTMLVTVSALKRLIYGDSEEDVVQEVMKYRSYLKDAGGPINPDQYGPRVRRVFDKLKS
ncbi:MAG TPA: hypothetical protein VK661_05190 [Planctomycetota bacterium]|nr:hypothetical protein [Planctomycetota bacterium]